MKTYGVNLPKIKKPKVQSVKMPKLQGPKLPSLSFGGKKSKSGGADYYTKIFR